ncbi:MAG TPA: hypothetical protein VJA23_02550 [Candidatus Nanoarchaeia archaeon]|nr:hypothetical protein [Candidatus Nanoarchaeia archaeon]
MDNKQLLNIINQLSKLTVNRLKDKGLISLYLAGTILSKDRTKHSDIDLFGIVDHFNFKEEEKLNQWFEKKRKTLCGGFECRFRGIPLRTLQGGKREGVTKFLHPQRLIRLFPFWKQLWGEKFNFEQKQFVKPMPLKKEAVWLIQILNKDLKKVQAGAQAYLLINYPKNIIQLIRVEAEHDLGFKFHPSYVELQKHLSKQKKHIIHEAIRLRNKGFTLKDVATFTLEVEKYLTEMRKKIKEWK